MPSHSDNARLTQVKRHTDGSCTIGFGHVIQLAPLASTHIVLKKLIEKFSLRQGVLSETGSNALQDAIGEAMDLDKKEFIPFLEEKLVGKNATPAPAKERQNEITQQANALTAALETLYAATDGQDANLRQNGVTLPKEQADAQFNARKIIFSLLLEEISDALQKKQEPDIKSQIDMATTILGRATYLDVVSPHRK